MRYMVKSDRIVCEAHCILHFDGVEFQGVIENISLSGALIKLKGTLPDSIRPGATCDMIFCSNPDVFPVKYTSEVVRLDSGLIGIEFLEINMM
jgi:c-di-GMP-binding flagellar brake protein YcgR